jgi:hypothetical protein
MNAQENPLFSRFATLLDIHYLADILLPLDMKRYVICLNNESYPVKLELRKVYEVVHDPMAEGEGFIRVIDETGEDYLYEASRFAPVELSQTILEAFETAHA